MENSTCSFKKYENSPVFGSRETGTMFDAYVWKQNGRLRMDVSWRPRKALDVTFSDDGIHWEEPVITLEMDPSTLYVAEIYANQGPTLKRIEARAQGRGNSTTRSTPLLQAASALANFE